jgi:hypothetical protein
MKISTKLVPTFSSRLLARIALGVGGSAVAIAISSAVVPQPSLAEPAGSVNPLQDLNRQNERDPMDIGGSSDFNFHNLIHRAQMGTGDLTDPSKSIDDAAARFQRERQRLLESQQQPGNPQMAQPQNSQQLPNPQNQVTNSPVGQ